MFDHANHLKIENLGSQGISESDLPLRPRDDDKFNMDRILNSSNIFINSTLNELRKRKKGHPTSPLTRPRVGELLPVTILDEWPWYNTSETYNLTKR